MATSYENSAKTVGTRKVTKKGVGRGILFTLSALFISITAIVGAFLFFANYILSNDNIYKGVMIEQTDVSGYSQDEIRNYLQKMYAFDVASERVRIFYDDVEREIDMTGKVYPDLNRTLDEAYGVGRKGNVFARLKDIFSAASTPRNFNINYIIDKQFVLDEVTEFANEFIRSNKIVTLDEAKGKLYVDFNNRSCAVDIERTADAILDSSLKGEFGSIQAFVQDDAKISSEEIMAMVDKPAVDASYEVVNNEIVYTYEESGRTLDYALLEQYLDSGEKKFELDIQTVHPKVTAASLRDKMFTDVLSEYSTTYSESAVDRTVNVSLASKSINGVVLGPGDKFSFNGSVGERSAERGYREAIVFVGGKLEDGLGGGICQVSSTLYSAVLHTGLEVVSRANHQFFVAYVPSGMDATVVYDAKIDFNFVNNTGWPVRIESTMNKGKLTVRIIGTKTDNKTYVIENQLVDTKPSTIKYEQDASVAAGGQVVKQKGQEGRTVDTYKIVYDNGVQVDKIYLHRSRYNPMEQIIKINGEPPAAPPAEGEKAPEPTPAQPTEQPIEQPEPTPAQEQPSEQPEQTPEPSPEQPEPTPEQSPEQIDDGVIFDEVVQ